LILPSDHASNFLTTPLAAIDEIANRLDGKPRQEVDATIDGSLEVHIIRFTPEPDRLTPGSTVKPEEDVFRGPLQ
jgi:hypothetical protein